MPYTVMIFLKLSLEVGVTSSALDEVFFTLCIQMNRDAFLLKLTLAMRTGKFCLFTILQMFSDFVTAKSLFTIHTLHFGIGAFFLHMLHYLLLL
jgi:hypothetical protein